MEPESLSPPVYPLCDGHVHFIFWQYHALSLLYALSNVYSNTMYVIVDTCTQWNLVVRVAVSCDHIGLLCLFCQFPVKVCSKHQGLVLKLVQVCTVRGQNHNTEKLQPLQYTEQSCYYSFSHLVSQMISLPYFVTICGHPLMTALPFALFAFVVVVFTFCCLNIGQESVHPSLLIAIWIPNHRSAPEDTVRMAQCCFQILVSPGGVGLNPTSDFFTAGPPVTNNATLGKKGDDLHWVMKALERKATTFQCLHSHHVQTNQCVAVQ